MKKAYTTVYKGYEAEIIEKKSKFIATIKPIASEEEAIAYIEELRKKYSDASHNCFAFVLGENAQIQRCSDDGEPSGTAGKPMLDILLNEGITNVLAVVTRYFGGTLLGTGGLVRTYANAVKAGLEGCQIIHKIRGYVATITTDYTALGKIQYLLGSRGITTLHSEFAEHVTVEIIIPIDDFSQLQEAITEGTNGKILVTKKCEASYSVIDGEVIQFN